MKLLVLYFERHVVLNLGDLVILYESPYPFGRTNRRFNGSTGYQNTRGNFLFEFQASKYPLEIINLSIVQIKLHFSNDTLLNPQMLKLCCILLVFDNSRGRVTDRCFMPVIPKHVPELYLCFNSLLLRVSKPVFNILKVPLDYDFNLFLGLPHSSATLQLFILLFIQVIEFLHLQFHELAQLIV